MANDYIQPQAHVPMFRYFCQKVLPAVYDDSLSYYELLCKLTDKINEVITTQNTQVDAIEQLQNLFTELQNYVDNYFSNLNVQNEINNKLDSLVADGTMDKIINENLFNEINVKIEDLQTELNTKTEELQTGLNNTNASLDVANQNIENMKTQLEKIDVELDLYTPSLVTADTSQQTLLIKSKDKNILIDLGMNSSAGTNVQYYTDKLQGEKVDVVIISHYHGDHIGDLDTFKPIFAENVKFYLPLDFTNYYNGTDDIQTITTRRNTVINWLTQNSVEYTEVNTDLTLNFKGFYIKLYNSTPEAYTHYNQITTPEYNTYSMVAYIFNSDNVICLPSDASNVTMDYLLSKNQVHKVSLLSAFHHGYYRQVNNEYYNELNPEIEFFTMCPDSFKAIKSQYETGLKTKASRYYTSAFGALEFKVNKDSTICTKGNFINGNLWNFKNYNLYVNQNYNGEVCGTLEKPFKTIEQALQFIPFEKALVTLHLASGTYDNTRIVSIPYYLTITGDSNNVVLKNFSAINCNTLRLDNLVAISSTDHNSFLFGTYYFSAVTFRCEVDNLVPDVTLNHCHAYFNSCIFGTGTHGIYAEDNCFVSVENSTFQNITGNAIWSISSFITFNDCTITEGRLREQNGGRITTVHVGTTAQRPIFNGSAYMQGYVYFDTSLKKPIIRLSEHISIFMCFFLIHIH